MVRSMIEVMREEFKYSPSELVSQFPPRFLCICTHKSPYSEVASANVIISYSLSLRT